jgi:hypothetical protein
MPGRTKRRNQSGWTATDRGMLVLVKLVLADDWSAPTAGRQLVDRIRDPWVLAQMTARVRAAQAERDSEVGRRAERTLSQARADLRAA